MPMESPDPTQGTSFLGIIRGCFGLDEKNQVLLIHFYHSPIFDESLACHQLWLWWPKWHPLLSAGSHNAQMIGQWQRGIFNNVAQFYFTVSIIRLLSTVVIYGCVQTENQWRRKKQANHWQYQSPCGCGGTMRGASPDGAHPGLCIALGETAASIIVYANKCLRWIFNDETPRLHTDLPRSCLRHL